MTDLEMVRLCAEAMGLRVREATWCQSAYWVLIQQGNPAYDPLTHDAQAMALVKRFRIVIDRTNDGRWLLPSVSPGNIIDADLNRAIVECVARMSHE